MVLSMLYLHDTQVFSNFFAESLKEYMSYKCQSTEYWIFLQKVFIENYELIVL